MINKDKLISDFYDDKCENINQLETLFSRLLKVELHGFNWADIKSRIKTKKSFTKKCLSTTKEGHLKYNHPNDIDDLLGIRIVVPYTNNLELVIDKILGIIDDNLLNSKSEGLRTPEGEDVFGYRSWHISIKIPSECGNKFQPYLGHKFEIQVRTITMHAWAILSHESLYKKQRKLLSKTSKRRLARASALLEQVDEIFDNIINELNQSEINNGN